MTVGGSFLPHITLKPKTEIIDQKVPPYVPEDQEHISDEDFRKKLEDSMNNSKVVTENLDDSYIVVDLNGPYYAPSVRGMIESFGMEVKSVVEENKLIVRAPSKSVESYLSGRSSVPNKLLKNIVNVRVQDKYEKLSLELLEIINDPEKEDEIINVALVLLDNLSSEEKSDIKIIIEKELGKNENPKYFEKSNQYTCRCSIKRITELCKFPFIKLISKLPLIKPQDGFLERDEQSKEHGLIYKNNEYNIVENKKTPIFCVLDSGISKNLENYCEVLDNTIYDTPYDDLGHGTRVNSIGLFGEDLIFKRKDLKQQSKVISIKIDGNSGEYVPLTESIMNAVEKYKNTTKVFCVPYNLEECCSEYGLDMARKLDSFIQKNNVIIVNSCGNIDLKTAHSLKTNYPSYLFEFPVYPPSQSKNVFSVGALCSSSSKGYCKISCNTRMGLEKTFLNENDENYNFLKPDLLTHGGNSDLSIVNGNLRVSKDSEIGVLDSNGNMVHHLGTSYAAPLTALCFSRLYDYYDYKNSETYKAILLNKSNHGYIDENPVNYLLDSENVINCNDGVYLNFEDTVTPKYRSEWDNKINNIECRKVNFYVPPEAESIDVVTVHSSNHKFHDSRRHDSKMVIKLKKGNGKDPNKAFCISHTNSAYKYEHYTFSRFFEGMWEAEFHLQTKGIPKDYLKDFEVRYGVSIRINIKPEYQNDLMDIYEKIRLNGGSSSIKAAEKRKEKSDGRKTELPKDTADEAIYSQN